MNLDETPQEAAFRHELRTWIDANIDPTLRERPSSFGERWEADQQMAKAGYLAITWPEEFGGRGASSMMAAILDDERARAGIPASRSPSRFGIHLLGPTLMAHGTESQQAEFLSPVLAAEQVWCQGFSEPEAGSDLANVQCFAEDAGTHLVLHGSKIWTTQASEADWCFALVRTDREAVPKHKGLTFVLVNMKEAGIEIQPLVQLTGDAEFSQVFFEGVRVDRDHVLGEPGSGWKVALTTLSAERAYAQLSRYRNYSRQLELIVSLLRSAGAEPRDGQFTELGAIYADLTGIRNLSYRIASLATAHDDLGSLSSITKLWWSETHQRLLDLGFGVAADLGIDDDEWYRQWLECRSETIYAGASEIQRNIIAERQLGLPR